MYYTMYNDLLDKHFDRFLFGVYVNNFKQQNLLVIRIPFRKITNVIIIFSGIKSDCKTIISIIYRYIFCEVQ